MTASDPVATARQVLGGKELKPHKLRDLAKDLKEEKEFGYAWRILARARRSNDLAPELSRELYQQQALCTYKDTHLHEDDRLDRALEILRDGENLQTSADPETLGLAGAIHKRRWRVRNDKRELETALEYYGRGHRTDREGGFKEKQGYPGINAAFVLDVLATLEDRPNQPSATTAKLVADRRAEAAVIRKEIVAGLENLLGSPDGSPHAKNWWVLVTMAEAHFGLRHYEAGGHEGSAQEWLERAAALPGVDPWEFESTARQLTTLAKILEPDLDSAEGFAESAAGRVLKAFLGDRAEGVSTAYLGKVGLALSGGGFRASLYHIGVLARLAELDALRHVEVLSCVSGGSILGAHYYLELRRLFKMKRDQDITREDYIECVRRVETGFLHGVQTNVRMRVLAEFLTNLKMIFLPGYSRTQRIGELYESEIYSNVDDGEGDERWLTDLFIVPTDEDKTFRPIRDNWRRKNKVPILVLNATVLNTGHNWQFTASWMGESPTTVDPDIDANYRLRRMYYDDAPTAHKRVRLGTAVGASACVPGLFEPIALKDLYEHPGPDKASKITVRLVDGGVHDNQGTVGLIEQDCDVMLVSDASGQMETVDDPSRGMLGVPLRTNSILMSRVRHAQYADIMERRRSELVRSLMFIHLKMDLDADPVDWIGSDEPHQASEDARPPERRGPRTRYGIRKSVQRLLAGIRTDLDSFNDAEAYALMLSGYRMAEFQFDRFVRGFPKIEEEQATPPWRFLEVEPFLEQAKGDHHPILEILGVASQTAFKVWRLSPFLRGMGTALGIAALVGLVWVLFGSQWSDYPLLTPRGIGMLTIGAAVTAVVGKRLMRIVQFRETLSKIAIGVGMSFFGFLIARLHLHVFDRMYLRLGRLDQLKDS